jgi:hypothetical protein
LFEDIQPFHPGSHGVEGRRQRSRNQHRKTTVLFTKTVLFDTFGRYCTFYSLYNDKRVDFFAFIEEYMYGGSIDAPDEVV